MLYRLFIDLGGKLLRKHLHHKYEVSYHSKDILLLANPFIALKAITTE
jgi:hypothetical protein